MKSARLITLLHEEAAYIEFHRVKPFEAIESLKPPSGPTAGSSTAQLSPWMSKRRRRKDYITGKVSVLDQALQRLNTPPK